MTNRRVVPGRAVLASVWLLLIVSLGGTLFAQTENLPPKPDRYITDQAGVIDAGTLSALNDQLEQFEKDTSNQLVVAIYNSLPPDAEIAQYATDTYNAWGIGQKGKDNGALLMIFIQDRKMFISTGRGLQGVLPDATCKNIITQVITPEFKQGNFSAGVQAGVDAMIAAAKGEFKGTGSTVDEQKGSGDQGIPWVAIVIFIIFVLLVSRYGSSFSAGPIIFTGGGWGGGGYGGGGYGGGGGGGGFSGGGGNTDGGGAGGSW